jgi:hypothetical protein
VEHYRVCSAQAKQLEPVRRAYQAFGAAESPVRSQVKPNSHDR